MLIAADAFLTDVDRFPWKSQSEFCVERATHKFKSLGFVCSPSFFSLPASCHPFLRGVIFKRAHVSLPLLSLRKNGSLIVNCLIPHLEKSNAMLICNTDAMGPVVNPHWH